MWRLGMVAVAAALISPTAASGQNYTFGDWARDQGYSPGDVMPELVDALEAGIDSLDGIGDFDWTTTPTTSLDLFGNQLSSIESGDFTGLTSLTWLNLGYNGLSSIESGDFSGLTNLTVLSLCFSQLSSIESGDFSGLTNLTVLSLCFNQLSSLEPGDFTGLTNLELLNLDFSPISSIERGTFNGLTKLTELSLYRSRLSSIESGAFSGLTKLTKLKLSDNMDLTELNLEAADFSHLNEFDVDGNENITSVSLRNTVVNQTSLAAVITGLPEGFFELDITEMDLSGIDFVDITDLELLYVMDDLTDLWFVNTQNVDAIALDELLNNLATIESPDTEGVLYMTRANYNSFNAAGGGLLADWNLESGHHVEFLQIGDVNHDTEVNGLDADPFVDWLLASRFDVAADMNGDGAVNGLDVDPFVEAVVGGVQQIHEPATLLLTLIALGVVGGWRRWKRAA